MKNRNFGKFLLMGLAVFWAGAILMDACSADETVDQTTTADVLLKILEWDLTIGIDTGASWGNIDLWEITPSFRDQTVSWTFKDSFWVEDLKWGSTGYYTTVQVTDLTWMHAGQEYKIEAKNVTFETTNLHLITWSANNEVEADIDTTIETPKNYIVRDHGTGGLLSLYGDEPKITVVIPANTPSAEYKGTITYTLYDLDN